MRFEVDRRQVVHETIDGEAILIHMETGVYYSLDGSGAEIWAELVAGSSLDEVAGRLRTRYVAPPDAIEAAVAELVDELRRERLLDEAGDDIPTGVASPSEANGDPRAQFEAPILHRYTDMADFMLVDPIHEVEESGWPNRKVAP